MPVDVNIKLSATEGALLENPTVYRKSVGNLLYLTNSHPDISYIVNHLRQFVEQPRLPHLLAVHRVLRYLKATPFQGLYYAANSPFQLEAFCDSDWILD